MKRKALKLTNSDYVRFVTELKSRIASARLSASRSVNREIILLYWDIGQAIVEKQEDLGWGKSVVERLARDLQSAFPGMSGFSARNLRDMRRMFAEYSQTSIWRQPVAKLQTPSPIAGQPIRRHVVAKLQGVDDPTQFLKQLVAEIPWGQNLLVLNKVKSSAARLYYLQATAQYGWTRNVLLNQIKARAYERSLKEGKSHNFQLALPKHFAEQAEEALKSSYSLEFLGIRRAVMERELEDRLIERVQQFILELGYGFCFVGRQYRLKLGEKEFSVDLLFCHRFLKALVAVDLKIGAFEPEHAGKMDFYLNLLNEQERAPGDQPSIGIILCAEKDELMVEFSLKSKTNPIGVAEHELTGKLPKELRGKLPSERELRAALLPPKTKEK